MNSSEEAFHYQVQQLENIVRELGSKGELGEDPAWVGEYAARVFEVGEALGEIAGRNVASNPSHKSYR